MSHATTDVYYQRGVRLEGIDYRPIVGEPMCGTHGYEAITDSMYSEAGHIYQHPQECAVCARVRQAEKPKATIGEIVLAVLSGIPLALIVYFYLNG